MDLADDPNTPLKVVADGSAGGTVETTIAHHPKPSTGIESDLAAGLSAGGAVKTIITQHQLNAPPETDATTIELTIAHHPLDTPPEIGPTTVC
jgi:hypothetical protein